MPDIALKGHHSAGHDACPAVPAVEGASTVHVAGRPVLRAGDAFAVHGCRDHPSHQGRIGQGAPFVHIEGRAVARKTDPISCGGALDHVIEGVPSVRVGNCGGDEYGREMAFSMLTEPSARLILCMEEIAAAEVELASERDRQGWAYLQVFMPKWLDKKAYVIEGKYDNGGQEPSFVDWHWMMGFKRFYLAYLEMMRIDYIFSPVAQAKLSSILAADGAFSGDGTSFNHIDMDWSQQRIHAFQSKPMGLRVWELILALAGNPTPLTPDGLQATVANVVILALASGETRKTPTGEWEVCISRVALFIHDGFEFSGDQPLGWWDCKNKQFSVLFGTEVTNQDFRRFREQTGYGCDFRIMSRPEVVWNGNFRYNTTPYTINP